MANQGLVDAGNFNSHPHEEDDEDLKRDGTVDDISTHILTKRMTVFGIVSFTKVLFQLTSSRRG